MNGNFLGLGADYACNASVRVDAAQAPGLLFTNGEFTAFHDSTFAPNNTAGECGSSRMNRHDQKSHLVFRMTPPWPHSETLHLR